MTILPQLLGDVEEHLGVTIGVVDTDMRVPTDELDGRVVYGSRKIQGSSRESNDLGMNSTETEIIFSYFLEIGI